MIHPTAIIAPEAELGANVEIGPYVVIAGPVELGEGSYVGPHAHLSGHTRIGRNARIHAGAVVGDRPQDLSYDPQAVSYTTIGDNCILREYVTIHRGSDPGSATMIGNNVMLMGFAHVGHNCHLEDGCIVANATLLAGHVSLGTRAFVSGGVMIHQFVRIGRVAMIHGGERLSQDVPPFCMLAEGQVRGPNTVGLRRAGIGPDERQAIRRAVKMYFGGHLNRQNALEKIRRELGDVKEVTEFVDFIEATRRGIMSGDLKGDS